MTQFNPKSLPAAVKKLFELNHYEVSGPVQLHGAEIDLVATSMSDPFASQIFIEVTIEYVDNEKYGKDVGKLALVAAQLPSAKKLIVSSSGFSLPVKERARATAIETVTYDELFKKFERFEPYVDSILGETSAARDIRQLDAVYEEPDFADSYGRESATKALTRWLGSSGEPKGWMVITGEYGTGKTALTRVLQYRWLKEYKSNPSSPLPIRIELREFSRQFDARGLLHHFLDTNRLSHISVDYVQSLIRSGRALLILDGYDEMAQYLHARERRACLEALADLSANGARGILTSRPNYFTEAEELQVFEILYASLRYGKYSITPDARELLDQEQRVDELLGQFIDRYERTLNDLSSAQTEALVQRLLNDDPDGKTVVLNILHNTFRAVQGADAVSLSGKPVIVSYLIQVVEGLKKDDQADRGQLTEWQVYKLIVDQLMLRDLRRSPELDPNRRRQFLMQIALLTSRRDTAFIDEQGFRDLINREFRRELSRQGENTADALERYFADLRSSATLTRASSAGKEGWRFSHNSLREFLVAECLLDGLARQNLVSEAVPISDAMRTFVASKDERERRAHLDQLRTAWTVGGNERGRGQILSLLWDGVLPLFSSEEQSTTRCLMAITGSPIDLSSVQLSRLVLSSEQDTTEFRAPNFSGAALSAIVFHSANLERANFSRCVMENVVLTNANLNGASFSGALLMDVEISGVDAHGADFSGIAQSDISILIEVETPPGLKRLTGIDALGYLHYLGAKTDPIPTFRVIQHHPSFPIVDKIIEKLSEQKMRQRRGLEQRGAARMNVNLARDFVQFLERNGLISSPLGRKDQVSVTERGRDVFSRYVTGRDVSEEIARFFVQP